MNTTLLIIDLLMLIEWACLEYLGWEIEHAVEAPEL
jgi:hypothetical protein